MQNFLYIFILLINLMTMQYSEKDILKSLDNLKPSFNELFPQIDNSLQYPISTRIHLYGDASKWAIVFEIYTYDKTGFTCSLNKYYFGNCINKQKISKEKIGSIENLYMETIISNENILKLEDMVSKKEKSNFVVLNNKKYAVSTNILDYEKNNIIGLYFEKPEKEIDIVSILRLMEIQNKNLFQASEAQLKRYLVPETLPKIMTIDSWHHKNYLYNPFTKKFDGEKPSNYETFQQIAKILVTKDVKYWQPTLIPNNHWSNWPNAGNY